MISEIIKANRTKRIFNGSLVSFDLLKKLIEDCRYSASTMNRQDIRYILVNDKKYCDEIFKITNLPTKHKVPIENSPGAYVIMVVNTNIKIPDSFLYYNLGIITANLTLSACSNGFSCVTLLSTNMIKLGRIISLDNELKVVSVVAIGKSDQKVITKPIEQGDISYYKEDGVHIVPKLTTKALILKEI